MEAQIMNSATPSHPQRQVVLYGDFVRNGKIDSAPISLPPRLWMPWPNLQAVDLRILEAQSVSAQSIGLDLNFQRKSWEIATVSAMFSCTIRFVNCPFYISNIIMLMSFVLDCLCQTFRTNIPPRWFWMPRMGLCWKCQSLRISLVSEAAVLWSNFYLFWSIHWYTPGVVSSKIEPRENPRWIVVIGNAAFWFQWLVPIRQARLLHRIVQENSTLIFLRIPFPFLWRYPGKSLGMAESLGSSWADLSGCFIEVN